MKNQGSDGQAVGIDLGTTYSCVSVFRNSSAEIVPNSRGNRTTPSYVAFTENETLVGDAAKDQSILNYKNTIFDSKRLMGCSISDSAVKKDIPYWPFEIIENDGEVVYKVKSRGEIINPTPQKIASEILSHLKESTENLLGNQIRDAVVTVPAYFNNVQRQSTIDAGTKAGLNILSILNEPTAAAIAYGFDDQNDNSRNVIVFDLGGGTFDVSLLNITRGNFRVLATHGNTHLGGNDFDMCLVECLQQEFENNSGYNIENDRYATSRLRIQSERVKCELSSNETASISTDSLHGEIDFHSCISRDKFNNLCDDLFTSTLPYLDTVLNDAKLNKSDIGEIIMVGGSTRICRVQELVSNYFNNKDINKSINPEEAVARGAAIHASKLAGNLENTFKDLSLVDVTPISLGIEIVGDILSTIVPRNTELPFRKTDVFSTDKDYQTNVEILVYEDEKKFSKANHFLGEFLLTGIPPALQCIPKIEVTFTVDTNGILKVRAYDRDSHNSKEIKIVYNVSHQNGNGIVRNESNRKTGDIVLAED